MPADTRTLSFRRSLLFAGGLAAVLTLAACGGSSASGSKGASSGPATGSSSSRAAASGGGRGPAANGKIAAITGTTMQVQNQQTGQVAVAWTSSTTFTHTVAVKASTITVGSCVTAIGGTGTSASAASFTAATVIVSRPQNGTCLGGFGGGAGPGGGFPSGARPSGFPSGARPSGFPGGTGTRRVGAVASGKVSSVSVSGSTLTVAAALPGSSSTTAKTVTLAATAKITTQATTTAKSLAVGQCVSAQGKADSSGTVTATRVQISSPTSGECTLGFGGLRGGGSGG